MFYSLNWLRRYVSLPDESPQQIALRLTMSTCEVEGVEEVRRCTANVVVGQVLGFRGAPDSDHMLVVDVDTGGRACRTVCGAPNVRKGMLSLYALPGAQVADGTVLEAATVSGVRSEGMLLSPVEVGIGEYEDFIFDLGTDVTPGTPFEQLCEPTDWLIEVDNKSMTHRPDLWGHYGLARELAAIYNVPLTPLGLMSTKTFESLPALDVDVLDTERCPRYCAIGIENLGSIPAPIRIQIDLLQVGLRPINLPVDLTNYVMAELAQPLHAFDWDTVQNVRIDTMKEPRSFVTLDDISRSMLPEDLMILDGTKPIAIAGVMGGAETEITEKTSHVFLECANFDQATIRRTSLRLGLRTDASQRFGRGQPHANAKIGVQRFLHLLSEADSQARVSTRLYDSAPQLDRRDRTVRLSLDSLDRLAGHALPPDRTVEILRSLQFEAEIAGKELAVTVPPHRSDRDISIPADIVEEVVRIYGFDNIEPAMPPVRMAPGSFNDKRRLERRLSLLLSQSWGLSEVMLYSWFDDDWLAQLGYEPHRSLHLKNPINENNTRMRTHLLPNLLRVTRQNLRHMDRVEIFEIARRYTVDGDSRTETTMIAGVVCARKSVLSTQACFTRTKGIIASILDTACIVSPVFEDFLSDEAFPWFDGPASLSVRAADRTIGHLGIPTATVLKLYPRGMVLACFELGLQALLDLPKTSMAFREPPRFPVSEKDYSILLPKDKPFGELEEILNRFSHPMILERTFLFAYEGTGELADVRSFTFRFSLYKPDATLTGDEIDAFHNEFLTFLNKHGLRIREA